MIIGIISSVIIITIRSSGIITIRRAAAADQLELAVAQPFGEGATGEREPGIYIYIYICICMYMYYVYVYAHI